MEYVPKINIFGLKMMMKSGLEKTIFEIPPCAKPFLENLFYFIERWILDKAANSVKKNCDACTYILHFEYVNEV